jgi:hypothetical protein
MPKDPGENGAPRHYGPAMRRKLGITLPGERTQAQLTAVNTLRRKAGQSILGGPARVTPSRSKPVKPSPIISALSQRRAELAGHPTSIPNNRLRQAFRKAL